MWEFTYFSSSLYVLLNLVKMGSVVSEKFKNVQEIIITKANCTGNGDSDDTKTVVSSSGNTENKVFQDTLVIKKNILNSNIQVCCDEFLVRMSTFFAIIFFSSLWHHDNCVIALNTCMDQTVK